LSRQGNAKERNVEFWFLPGSEGGQMKIQEFKYVTHRRAALLLGLSEEELCDLSCESGLGLRETADGQDVIFFTYEDLRQICVLATQHVH
jgi:hypothetical protein